MSTLTDHLFPSAPLVRAIRVGPGGTARHDLAPSLALEPLHGRQDRRGVDDEEVLGPGDDGRDSTLAGVAGAMGQPLLAVVTAAALGLGLRLALGGAQVDARPAGVVDGHLGIHRLVAQPAAPPVLLADLVAPAPRPHLTPEKRRIPGPYRPSTRPHRHSAGLGKGVSGRADLGGRRSI